MRTPGGNPVTFTDPSGLLPSTPLQTSQQTASPSVLDPATGLNSALLNLQASGGASGSSATPGLLLAAATGVSDANVLGQILSDAGPEFSVAAATRPQPSGDCIGCLTYTQAVEVARENNLSRLPVEMIVAIMYKESTFNPQTTNPKSTATGLMGITAAALRDVLNSYTGFPSSPNLFDPATNAQVGSAYLDIRLDVFKGNLQKTLAQYGTGPEYAAQIIAATRALQKRPTDPLAVLRNILHGGR